MKPQKMLKTKRALLQEIGGAEVSVHNNLSSLFLTMESLTPGAENKEFLAKWRHCLQANISAMFDQIQTAGYYALAADSKTGKLK
jgi:hypothetical protein